MRWNREILALRTVNKSWNVSMLSEFRHRSRTNEFENSFKISSPKWFFSGAEIETWNIHDRYPHLNHFVHREIVETLYGEKKSYLKKIYGMKWLCPGCDTCLDFADECDEHDFITMEKLGRGFPDGKVFQNIEVGVG
ncbi:hypothetical protein B9Z55_000501 [Caenorhabditis nigoni]|uniref:Uncharacterized protein n=1 Tax=Caenorhabditis nigoni TaxID=1611254 RepID=A0A2G5VTC8_9PELO|nr:hypothetical protein B9Z55_000501 [Caenorhabditis nigoni]